MNVLVAPDSLRGSATVAEVAGALTAGWSAVRPHDVLHQLPMANGEEGTLAALAAAVPGARSIPVTVTGPDDRAVTTRWLLLLDGTGVVELAGTSGLTLLDRLRPADAHARGFGEAIEAALDHSVARLLLALGGSSSTDGGTGVLTALGARCSTGAATDAALAPRMPVPHHAAPEQPLTRSVPAVGRTLE